MNEPSLLHAMSNIGDDLILAAEETNVRRHFLKARNRRKRFAAAAACLMLLAAAAFMLPGRRWIGKGSDTTGHSPQSAAEAERTTAIVQWYGLAVTETLAARLQAAPEAETQTVWIQPGASVSARAVSADLQAVGYRAQAEGGGVCVVLSAHDLKNLPFAWTSDCIFGLPPTAAQNKN